MFERVDDSPNEGPAPNPDFSRAYVLPDSDGGYIAGSSDGFEVLTPAPTPEEAIENLQIAKMVERARELGLGFEISLDDEGTMTLEELAEELGFDPDDFKPEAE